MRRRLEPSEAETLLDADVPARLATIGSDGFPHITPLWFVWTDRAFYMTSSPLAAHCKRLAADSRASVCLDIEAGERGDGQRPNRRIVAVGHAEVFPDAGGQWTRRITEKYVRGSAAAATAQRRASGERFVIRLSPARMIADASV